MFHGFRSFGAWSLVSLTLALMVRKNIMVVGACGSGHLLYGGQEEEREGTRDLVW